jgi:hypothetical protein
MVVVIISNACLKCVREFYAAPFPLALSYAADKFILCGGESKPANDRKPTKPPFIVSDVLAIYSEPFAVVNSEGFKLGCKLT